jgi:hypothetical protein
MGKEGIRYAAKVSLDKPANEQECLHVCYSIHKLVTLSDFDRRTAGTQTVRQCFINSGMHLC